MEERGGSCYPDHLGSLVQALHPVRLQAESSTPNTDNIRSELPD